MQIIRVSVAFVFAALISALPHSPQIAKRGAKIAFVNDDGTIDLPGLCGDSNITPYLLPPSPPASGTTTSSDPKVSNLISPLGLVTSIFGAKPYNVYIPSTLGNPTIPQGLSYNAFVNWADFGKSANAAPNTCASGKYTSIYKNQKGAYYNPLLNSYLAQSTHFSYDPEACAKKCESITGCMSYDIYYERDPITDPKANTIFANPSSITNIVCSYYGIPISTGLNTDSGKTIASFQTAKAGCDGYSKPFPAVAPPLAGYSGNVYKGGLDNRIATGNGAAVGPEYAQYDTPAIQYVSHLTKNPYFDPVFCKQIADTIQGSQSFDTFPILVGGDDKSQPYRGAGGRYAGQGCIIFSVGGYFSGAYNDEGQYGHDDVTGKDGAFFSHGPNFHYDRV